TRNKGIDPAGIDDVMLGCANQAGEDNRNIARMALLLAGLPETVPGVTINRLCGSGMDAIGSAARAIRSGEAEIVIAGGVESMSRAPFVIGKADEPFSRNAEMHDTTIGWRFINDAFNKLYGTDSMIQTAENIAALYKISREDQDIFAMRSQEKASQAQTLGFFGPEMIPVTIPQKKGDALVVDRDEHPRLTSLEKLSSLKPITGVNGTVTAGNASGVNDGASVLLIASEYAVKKYKLSPAARIRGMAVAGVSPAIMGMGPVPATMKLMARTGLTINDTDIIELNEAFAAQALGCIRELGLSDDDPRINRQGGAIAIGHPLGMSGARIVTTAFHQLQRTSSNIALCTMCIGVGQGISIVIERV
ncbi:MAG: acetyl-CoA C-acyltransferase, partial [Bacteroidetes bacterium]|nr:acetyl-CoA C-acyltransferase [Bacteroidota bacterium]